MTHGDETGPEKHQDSAVLTYLEGLLMHRVAGAQNATATQRSEAEKGKEEQESKESPGLTLPRHSTQQERDKISPHGSTHHVKKARLLRSEAWTNHESQMSSVPPVELSKEKQEQCSGLNGSLQWKGESTLLASLLQNYCSTRLQNVALSQQISQNVMTHNDTQDSGSKPEEEHQAPRDVHGSSPGLSGNSTVQNHSSSKVYHHRQSSQEKLSKSPVTQQHSSQSPSSESLPCTERLKAVASMVHIRSSPAPSPKPSVACSQLALLLSSEAHLQQYSREHAIKAQLAGRSASERLAAMATQQEKQPTIYRPAQTNHDGLSPLQTNGKPPDASASSSRQSSMSIGQSRTLGSVRRTHPFRERRPFERHSRPTQNCSSLLLQLLNSHNTPQQLNCQGHMKEDVSIFSSQASPMFSDSEQSNSAYSLPKDSSDAESSRSSCSPIDLSLKRKVNFKVPHSSSYSPPLEKLSESMKNRWTPECKELHNCTEIKPHHKVTLLELLLDQKHNQKTNKCLNSSGLQPLIIPKVSSASENNQALFFTGHCTDARESSPNCGRNSRSPKVLPTFSQGRDCNIRASPYNLYSPPHTQSVPLDLCKNKPTVSGSSVKEPAFSASKLLQNLAQCGTQNAVSPPPLKSQLPPIKRQLTEEFKSASLLEKLTAPIQKSSQITSEATQIKSQATRLPESTQQSSQIENLLERRTVLQLLLGNKSKKERVGIKRKRESGKHTSKCINTVKTPSPDILVKDEPVEDCMFNDRQVTRNILLESPRQSSHAVNQVDVKLEPQTSIPVPRDGLLSRFSYNQPTDLKPNYLVHSKRGCIKEEQTEHQGPTIPKKRKILVEPEDQDDMSKQGMYNSSCTQKDNSNFSISEIAETQESSNPCSPPAADSPPAKFPPCESPRNNTGGFNVLKQLLLSDNCLKELAQSRSTFSTLTHPVGNGSTIKEPCNNRELQNFGQTLNPRKMYTVRPELNRQSVSDVHQDSPRSKHDIISERDSKSLANGDKRVNCDLDSPRMTKSNPILYYMLQRNNAHFARDSDEPSTKVGHCRVQIKDKEASEASDGKVNLRQSPHIHNGSHSCDSPRLNGSLKKTALD